MSEFKNEKNLSKEQVDLVVALYSSGKFKETIDTIYLLNKEFPNVPLLFNILGASYKSLKHFDKSVLMFERAIAIKEDYSEAHKNLGVTYKELNQLSKAVDCFKNALKNNPNYIDALYSLANTYKDLGELDNALNCYQKVIDINSSFAEAHNNIANTLKDLGRLEESLNSYNTAININPNIAEIHNNLGNALKDMENLSAALKSYNNALSINPKFSEAYYNKGIVLKRLRKLHESVENFSKAIDINPDFAEAYNNLGSSLNALGKSSEAIKCCEKAISLKPNYAEAYNNFGNILKDLRMSDAAEKYYEKAIEIRPEYAEAYSNLGTIYSDKKNKEKALVFYQKAYKIDPHIDFLLGDILNTKMNLCKWEDLETELNELKDRFNNNQKVIGPFPLLSLIDEPHLQKKASEMFSSFYYPKNDSYLNLNRYEKHERIRIGYFSADFKQHPVATLTAELYELHDRSQFEIHAFSFGPDTKDEMNLRIKAGVDFFHDVLNSSHEDIVNLARFNEIDIAIDLGGYTAKSRTEIFAMSVAAIQISYIGYLGTMGAEYYDYLIADKVMIPEHNQKCYTEKIVYLPNFQVNDSKESPPDINLSREDVGLPDEGFVFCCFNNTYKITPTTFDSWARILDKTPGSVLLIYANSESSQNNLTKEIIQRGVDPKRLIFGKSLPRPEYLARYRVADLFLDTSPYNAGTTASDALRMGLPVLTLKGNAYPSRMAASILNAVHLQELITSSQEEYETLAIEFAKDPLKLKTTREKLLNNLETAPLYDATQFTKNIESAYLQMHKRHYQNLKPKNIIIEHQKS
jgi:protein O-GlcNAc transferase